MQFGIPNLSCTAIYESAPKDASARGKAIDTTRMQYVCMEAYCTEAGISQFVITL